MECHHDGLVESIGFRTPPPQTFNTCVSIIVVEHSRGQQAQHRANVVSGLQYVRRGRVAPV